jgi:hypothetical protein
MKPLGIKVALQELVGDSKNRLVAWSILDLKMSDALENGKVRRMENETSRQWIFVSSYVCVQQQKSFPFSHIFQFSQFVPFSHISNPIFP